MACISCGVITSAWVWRNSSRCESAMPFPAETGLILASRAYTSFGRFQEIRYRSAKLHGISRSKRRGEPVRFARDEGLEAEFLAQIEPPHIGVVHDVVGPALHQ